MKNKNYALTIHMSTDSLISQLNIYFLQIMFSYHIGFQRSLKECFTKKVIGFISRPL